MKLNILNKLYILLALFLAVLNFFVITKYKYENDNKWSTWACIPKYNDSIKRFSVDIIKGEIHTLKNDTLGLSIYSYSEDWGSNSGEHSDNQYGIPVKADIIFFSEYEDKFYQVKMNFNPVYIKKAFEEIHYTSESDIYDKYAKINGEVKGSFNGLVFGFAPQGMVAVWLVYDNSYIKELGRFQGKIIKGDKKYDEKIKSDYFNKEITRDEIRKTNLITDLSLAKWSNYHKRYNLKIETISENKAFRLFESRIENYNGEFLFEFRPEIEHQIYTLKALPKRFIVNWETGLNQSFQGNIFFNEKIIFEKFKDLKPNENQDLKIKIAPDNSSIEILLNNEPIKMDSIRIWSVNGDKI